MKRHCANAGCGWNPYSPKPRTGTVLGRFRLRRLEKVNIEALLIASGQNIKRLVAARDQGPRKLAQAAALRPPDPVCCCRSHVTGRWPSFAEAKAYFNRLASLEAALTRSRTTGTFLIHTQYVGQGTEPSSTG